MKKILIVLGSLLLSVVALLLLVPLFYSIDDLRPKLEQQINAKLKGEVSIGHLSFALFPSVKLGIEKLELKENKGAQATTFSKIDSVRVQMPLLSLITSPKATLKVDTVDLFWVSEEGKGDTLARFLPDAVEQTAETASPEAINSPVQTNPLENVQKEMESLLKDVPAWIRDRILNAKFSFEVLNSKINAQLLSRDSSIHSEISAFDFRVLNIGFNEDVEISTKGSLKTSLEGIKLEGPFSAKGTVNLIPKEGAPSELKFQLTKNLNDLAIQAFDLLDKKSGTPLQASLAGVLQMGEESKLDVSELGLTFGGIKTNGTLKAVFKTFDAINADLLIKSDNIDLAGLSALVPMVGTYKLKGQSSFSIGAQGLLSDPNISVDASMSGISGSTPELAHPIEKLKGEIKIRGKATAPIVEMNNFSMLLGRSDLEFWMRSQGLERISLNFGVKSKLLDVDHIMGIDPAASAAAGSGGSSGAQAPVAAESLDAVLEEMAPMVEEQLKNEMLDKISVRGKIAFQKIRVVGAEYTNAEMDMNLNARKFSVSSAEMGAYGGKMNAKMDMVLNPSLLEYNLDASLNNILVESAIAAHTPEWKDDITGKLVGNFKLSGKGLRKAQLAKNLRGSLVGSMKDGRLQMPVLKTLTSVMDKLPDVAKTQVTKSSLGNTEFKGEFTTLKLDSLIEGRLVRLKELDVVYDPQKAQLGDFRFKTNGTVTFDKDIDFNAVVMTSPNVIRVGEWKGSSGLVEIPMKLKGTMDEPKPDYGYTSKILGEKLAKGAAQKVIQQAAPKVIEKIQDKLPEPAKKKVDDLRKKFGF